GPVRDPSERHRSGTNRRHRGRSPSRQRRVARGGLATVSARPARHDRRRGQCGAVPVLRRRILYQWRHARRRRRAVAAIGAGPRRLMVPWASGVCSGVHAAGSRDVVYVPDNPLSHVLRDFEARFRDVRLILAMREEEAFGAAAVAGGIRTTGVNAFETRLPAACLLSRRLTSPTVV